MSEEGDAGRSSKPLRYGGATMSFRLTHPTPNLRELELSAIGSKWDAVSLYYASAWWGNLRVLALPLALNISHSGDKGSVISAIVKHCPLLNELNSEGCPLSAESIMAIGQTLKGLQRLNLRYCNGVTSRGLRAVVEGCPALRVLDLCYCQPEPDIATMAVVRDAASALDLIALDISGFRVCTDDDIKHIVKVKMCR